MASRREGIGTGSRFFLHLFLPITSYVTFMIIVLGCSTTSLKGVYLAEITSNGNSPIGGSSFQIDLRVGYLGICFGPNPYFCTTTALSTITSDNLDQAIPITNGGGVEAIAHLAQALQNDFAVASAVLLAVLLLIAMFTNFYEFFYDEYESAEDRVRMALWTRGLDWAVAGSSVIALVTYLSLAATVPDLITAAFRVRLGFATGTAATALYFVVAGTAALGALLKTLASPGEVRNGRGGKAKGPVPRTGMGEGLGEAERGLMRRPSAPYESNLNRTKTSSPVSMPSRNGSRSRPDARAGTPQSEAGSSRMAMAPTVPRTVTPYPNLERQPRVPMIPYQGSAYENNRF